VEKERERRQHAIDRAQGALDAAHRKHEGQAEEARWEKERIRLQAALRRALG
jgi:hypothetical protein